MRFVVWILLLLLPHMVGCTASPLTTHGVFSTETLSADSDVQTIVRCADRMEQCFGSIQRLQNTPGRRSGFFLPRDQDLLEYSLAEYLNCRNELEYIARRQQRLDADLHRLSLNCKTQCDVHLASLAVEDPVLWRALNQSFHRSDIPRGSCDRILHEVTASQAAPLAGDAKERVHELIRRRGWLLPAFENELWHAQPMELLFGSGREVYAQLQRGQNLLATGTGLIKNPIARPLLISDDQRRQIRNALQPGDVLLTYSAGYMCNLAIPGNFKHAVTFVGTDEERRKAGMPPETLLAIAAANNQRLARVLAQTTIETGEAADMVEAVAEGVLLNNLNRMLASRINRLVALRPRLNHAERTEQISDVLSYVGDEFDFAFDLTDASDQVCTEVVYRSLQGRGGIDLTLSEHAGRLTLTPDDILRYCTQRGSNQFECILVVDEAPDAAGAASILHSAEAQLRIAQLLGAQR